MSKYHKRIRTETVDVYDVLTAYGLRRDVPGRRTRGQETSYAGTARREGSVARLKRSQTVD